MFGLILQKLEELMRKVAGSVQLSDVEKRLLLADVYGYEPLYMLLNLISKGADVLLMTYFETPPVDLSLLWNSSNATNISWIKDIRGYTLQLGSSDGNMAHVAWKLLDISQYNELMIMARLVPLGEGRGPYIELWYDINNKYDIGVGVPRAASDFLVWKVYNGTSTVYVYEAVDLSVGDAQAVAVYYDRSTGRFLVWRNGVLKFDFTDTDVSPTILGFYAATTSSTDTRRVSNPMVIVGL